MNIQAWQDEPEDTEPCGCGQCGGEPGGCSPYTRGTIPHHIEHSADGHPWAVRDDLPPGDYTIRLIGSDIENNNLVLRWLTNAGDLIEDTIVMERPTRDPQLSGFEILDALSPHEAPPTVDIDGEHYELAYRDMTANYEQTPGGLLVPPATEDTTDFYGEGRPGYLRTELARRYIERYGLGYSLADWQAAVRSVDRQAREWTDYPDEADPDHDDYDIDNPFWADPDNAHRQWFDAKDQEVNSELEAWDDFMAETARKAQR